LEDGKLASLADHEVSPLHNDDRNEEGRVAGELNVLALIESLKGEGQGEGGWEPQSLAGGGMLAGSTLRLCHVSRLKAYPLLSVRVGQVHDGIIVPLLADAKDAVPQPAVLGQDGEVSKKAGAGLDEANLEVGHADEAVVD